MNKCKWLLVGFLVVLLSGCPALNQIANNSPAAQLPSNPDVIAILKRGGPWVNVGRSTSGTYEILPGGLPSGGFQLYVDAPYPGALEFSVNGAVLPRFEDIASGTDPASTGYYKLIDVNVNLSPAKWHINLRPPNSMLGMSGYTLAVVHRSINPNYPVGHPNHQSSALNIVLGLQKVYTVTVLKAGTGSGTVTSTPNGIACGGDCIFDFMQSQPVQLQALPRGNARFSGWSGACSGTGICVVTPNGTALTVTATFDGNSGSNNAQQCPGPAAKTGFTYLGKPGCATNDIAGHPSAELQCDGQGYFCCELANGVNDPRCGLGNNGKRQFPPDCMDYGPKGQLFQPDGCYARD